MTANGKTSVMKNMIHQSPAKKPSFFGTMQPGSLLTSPNLAEITEETTGGVSQPQPFKSQPNAALTMKNLASLQSSSAVNSKNLKKQAPQGAQSVRLSSGSHFSSYSSMS